MNAPLEGFTRAAHADSAAIIEFAAAMASKMHQAAMKGHTGWENLGLCTTESLQRALQEHVVKDDPVDVANYAMMLHARGAGTAIPGPRAALILENIQMRAALRAVLDEVSPGCTPMALDSSLPRSLIDLVDRAANHIGA